MNKALKLFTDSRKFNTNNMNFSHEEFELIKKALTPTNLGDVEEDINAIHHIIHAYTELQSDNLTVEESKLLIMNNMLPLKNIKKVLSNRVITADEIVKELNEWVEKVYPKADNVKFDYRNTKSVLGFYIEDESLFFEYHKSSKTYEQYDGENTEFTVPLVLTHKITTFFTQQKEAQNE